MNSSICSYNINFGNVEVVNQTEHIGIDGKHYLVIHGDLFDGITRLGFLDSIFRR